MLAEKELKSNKTNGPFSRPYYRHKPYKFEDYIIRFPEEAKQC